MKIYQVGGAVRDRLLGLEVKDRDWVVVGATAEDMIAAGYRPVGSDFPVFLHPHNNEEYALARTERKSGRGYKGFAVHAAPDVTLEDDLRRRDLTINAMAEDGDGTIIDPFGGRRDLREGVLRHVSPAFAEDPLRVLRVARFAARLQFRIADETLSLMRAMSAGGELDELVAERVWTETERALGEANPVLYFETLRKCGALAVIFPELAALWGVPQPEKHHPEIDTGVHTMLVLAMATKLSPAAEIRFAALTHDLGKAKTPPELWPKHTGHEARGVEIIKHLGRRLRIPKRYRELAMIVARHHLDCHRITEMRPETVVKKLEMMDAFRRPDRFEQFLLACEADARGRTGLEDQPYPQADCLRRALRAARAVRIDDMDTSGLDGPEVADAIRLRRIEAVAASMGSEAGS